MDGKETNTYTEADEEKSPSPTLEQVDFWTLLMEQMGR